MPKTPSRKRKVTVFISTFLILAIAAFGYFYLYIQQREDALRARHFRVLDLICNNILAQYDTYQKNANNNAIEDLNTLEKEVLNVARSLSECNRKDTLSLDTANFGEDRKFHFKRNNERRCYLNFEDFEKEYEKKINLKIKILKVDQNAIRFSLKKSDQGWDIVHQYNIDDLEGWGVELARPVSELMTKVLREDVFDELVVFREDVIKNANGSQIKSTKDSTASEGNENSFSAIFQTLDLNFHSLELENKMDSLLKWQLDPDRRHQLDGIPYQIYLKPLQISQEDKYYVCGLINQQRYNLEKAQIPMLIILFLVIIAMLLVLSIPFLKLRLIGRGESLGVMDVVTSLMAFILGTWLLVLLLVDGYRYFIQDKVTRKKQLEELHEEISQAFFEELGAIYRQLGTYDSLRHVKGDGPSDSRLFKDGQDKRLEVLRDTAFYPENYPFFKAVLWANDDYVISHEVAPGKNSTAKVSIRGRQYLERLENNQPWKLPEEEQEGEFMLESILTRTTGDLLASVSRRSRMDNVPIVFLTTNLYSVINPVLPQGFGFAIIDEKGDVLFHSDRSHNLQENFFEESDNKDFSSVIFSRAALHASGNYLGSDHNFFIKPLDKIPLFLITFEDKSYQQLGHSQVLGLNFFLSLIFLFSAIIFIGLLYMLTPKGESFNQNTFLLDWLKPKVINTGNYRNLILINLSILLLAVLFSWSAEPPTVISIIILSNFYAFIFAYLFLNLNAYKEFVWESQWQHLAAQFAIFVLLHLFLFLGMRPDPWQILKFEMIPLSLVIFRVIDLISKETGKELPTRTLERFLFAADPTFNPLNGFTERFRKSLRQNFDTQRSYRFFFLSWLMISSIYPGIKFYEISYDHEQRLLVQWGQVDLVKDISSRNEWIDNRYRDWGIDEPTLALRQDLKKRAIYSEPFFDTKVWPYQDLKTLGLEIAFSGLRSKLDNLAPGTGEDIEARLSLSSPGYTLQLPVRLTTRGVKNENAGDEPSRWVLKMQERDTTPQLTHRTLVFEIPGGNKETDITGGLRFRENREKSGDASWVEAIRKDKPDYAGFKNSLQDIFQKDLELTWQLRSDNLDLSGNAEVEVQPYFSDKPELKTDGEKRESLFDMLTGLRLLYDETVRQTNRFNEQQSANKLWFWRQEGKTLNYLNEGEKLYLSSQLPHYTFPNPLDGNVDSLLFWLLFLVIFYLLYQTLDFQISYLFAQHTLDKGYLPRLSNKQWLLHTNDNVFLVVPPTPLSSDHPQIIRWKAEELMGKNARPLVIDMDKQDLPDFQTEEKAQLLEKSPFLVLDNFARNIEDPVILSQRIQFLSWLLENYPDKQLIMVSSIDQIKVKEILESSDGEISETVRLKWEQQRKEKSWLQFLSRFVKIIYPTDRWQRLTQTHELIRSVKLGPTFYQTGPARYEQVFQNIVARERVGRFSFSRNEDSDWHYHWTVNDEDQEVRGELVLLDSGTDFNRSDLSLLGEKLNLLEEKIRENENIHLLANFNPTDLIRQYDEAIKAHPRNKKLIKEKLRWQRLLLQLRRGLLLLNLSRSGKTDNAVKAQNRILKECNNGDYLQSIQHKLITQFGDGNISEEEIIRNIEIRAQLYYQALWNSLPEEEQFLTYELSIDGIANGRNREVFNNLVRKGIIITSGDSPVIMNKSFRNFITTVVAPEVIRETIKKSSDEVTWKNLRWPIVIVIMALLTFLFATQKDFIDRTLAFFTGMAAVIPVITGIVTSLTTLSSKMPNFPLRLFGKKSSG